MKQVAQYPIDPHVRAIQESWDAVLPVEEPDTKPTPAVETVTIVGLVSFIAWGVLKLLDVLP